MDLTIVGSALAALLVLLPAATAYFQRQTRLVRRQNRQLRALAQEQDVWLYHLERLGWTLRGQHPPERPPMLRSVDDDEDGTAPPPAPGLGPGDSSATARRARHATEG